MAAPGNHRLIACPSFEAIKSTPVVLIKANVCRLLESRMKEDGFNVLNGGRAVYFPSNGRQPDFRRQFDAVLKSTGKAS